MPMQTIHGMGPASSPTDGYSRCERSACAASLEHLVLGGVGDWSNTIMCRKCFHTRRGVPMGIINTMAAERYGITRAQAQEAYERAQAQYEASLVDGTPRYHIPVSYEGGLPLLERWRTAYAKGDAP